VTPAETSDLLEIQQLIYRYAWGIDQRDFALLDTVFTPDAEVHYNVFGGTQKPWTEMRDWLAASLTIHRVTQHGMSNPMIELAGDAARARTYGNLVHVQEMQDGTPNRVTQFAIYHDELARTAEGWRIAQRRLDNLFIEGRFHGPDRVKTFRAPEPY